MHKAAPVSCPPRAPGKLETTTSEAALGGGSSRKSGIKKAIWHDEERGSYAASDGGERWRKGQICETVLVVTAWPS